eukprot:4901435-Pyramimonas_sp.AAC.1
MSPSGSRLKVVHRREARGPQVASAGGAPPPPPAHPARRPPRIARDTSGARRQLRRATDLLLRQGADRAAPAPDRRPRVGAQSRRPSATGAPATPMAGSVYLTATPTVPRPPPRQD